jgi:hypothetical protein
MTFQLVAALLLIAGFVGGVLAARLESPGVHLRVLRNPLRPRA